MDSITVYSAPLFRFYGFIPKKTFVMDGKLVISYKGKRNSYNDNLWIDGVEINRRYDVQSAILPCYYNGRLFFVFQKDRMWGWCYDGEMYYNVWDRVSHLYGQGESIPDIRRPTALTGFTAERGGGYYTCRVVIKELSD